LTGRAGRVNDKVAVVVRAAEEGMCVAGLDDEGVAFA
jgi:hypothetical protein